MSKSKRQLSSVRPTPTGPRSTLPPLYTALSTNYSNLPLFSTSPIGYTRYTSLLAAVRGRNEGSFLDVESSYITRANQSFKSLETYYVCSLKNEQKTQEKTCTQAHQ